LQPTFTRALPIIVSILIILAVAYLRNQSRVLAAILATMPINIPLALWVISGSDGFKQSDLIGVTQNIMYGLVPSLVFVVVIYLAARAGWSLPSMLLVGYLVWGALVTLGFVLGLLRS
jgi:hypothetical protein